MSDLNALINRIPMKRWFLAAKRLEMSSEEILNEPTASLVMAANEKAGLEAGNFDQFDRFLVMGLQDIQAFINDDADDEGADKSVSSGAGDRVPGDESPVLPLDEGQSD